MTSGFSSVMLEVITTYELTADFRPQRTFSLRGNAYHTRFENQIAYSAANFNLSTNISTAETLGLELEVLFSRGAWSAFANWSWAHRVDEEVLDETVAESVAPERPAGETRGRTILLVEDDADVRDIAREVLERAAELLASLPPPQAQG